MKNKRKNGFTLIEILIGITMTAFIFIAVATLMNAVMLSSRKERLDQTLKQTKNDLQIDITNNLKWATLICIRDEGEGIYAKNDTEDINYTIDDGRILKNGEFLTSKNVDIKSFKVIKHKDESIEIVIDEMFHKQKKDLKDTMRLVISPRNKQEGECL